MKAVVSVCVFGAVAMVVAAAPTLKDSDEPQVSEGVLLNAQPQILRQKRSQYGYAAPCGGAAIAPLPHAIAPIPAVAPAYLGPYHGGYGAPHSYGYGAPHYRADDMGDDHETFFPSLDNMMTEHMPMARYGGYAAPVAHSGAASSLGSLGQLVAPSAAGPAFGVFPNANVGGCNVPLLLSCSPSIVPGRLVKSQGYGYGAAQASVAAVPTNVYRGVDDGHSDHEDLHHSDHEEHEATHEPLAAPSDTHKSSTHA